MDRINIDVSPEQAEVVKRALDLYSRILMGQLGEVSGLMRDEILLVRGAEGEPPRPASLDEVQDVENLMRRAIGVVGHPGGSYFSIGTRGLHVDAKRAYEVRNAVAKVLAERRDPNPEFRGVDYDGVHMRYTQDPAPLASCVPHPPSDADRPARGETAF
jgi:hypothetical protein